MRSQKEVDFIYGLHQIGETNIEYRTTLVQLNETRNTAKLSLNTNCNVFIQTLTIMVTIKLSRTLQFFHYGYRM